MKAFHFENIALLSGNLFQKRKMLKMRVGGVMCRLEFGNLKCKFSFQFEDSPELISDPNNV